MSKKALIGAILFILFFSFWYYLFRNIEFKNTGEAQLSWNPSIDGDVKGYKIYYGNKSREGECPMGGYENKIDVGNKTNYKVKNLEDGRTYYFSVTSYNQGGKESCFSEEMNKKIDISFVDKIKNINFK